MAKKIWRTVKPPITEFSDELFWSLHEKFASEEIVQKRRKNMDRTEFNPLIPGNAVEDCKVSDNPLIPESMATSGQKRLASAVSSKSKGVPSTGARRLLSSPTSVQLATINQFANRVHVADELLVGQMRLANNCIDRDRERFSEEILQNFADTVVRKTLLLDHDCNVNRSAIGKFFAVEVERMPLKQAIAETGEALQLAPGMSDVLFLSPWFYIPKKGVSEQDFARLESGIYDFVSIGFSAERLVPITDGQGTTLFHEYQGRGYCREGSIVYLGAQEGAAIKGATTSVSGHSSAGESSNPLIPKDFQELDIEGTKTGESDQSENDSTRKPQKGGITHVGK